VVALSACGAVNTRPYLTPLPGALVDTLRADPTVVVEQLATQVINEGIAIGVLGADEGFLETRWHELESPSEEGSAVWSARSTIRLRFFADPIGDRQTQLTSEAIALSVLDPSLPEREREVLVATDHPGNQLVRRIVDALRAELGDPRP
jgi:hypothetical protein